MLRTHCAIYSQTQTVTPRKDIKQVHVNDEGSRPHFVRVELQGVPMHGVLDTGEDMTIMNGPMFKQVPINAS